MSLMETECRKILAHRYRYLRQSHHDKCIRTDDNHITSFPPPPPYSLARPCAPRQVKRSTYDGPAFLCLASSRLSFYARDRQLCLFSFFFSPFPFIWDWGKMQDILRTDIDITYIRSRFPSGKLQLGAGGVLSCLPGCSSRYGSLMSCRVMLYMYVVCFVLVRFVFFCRVGRGGLSWVFGYEYIGTWVCTQL